MTNSIKRVYTRHYTDNGQRTAYVDWADGSRTESTTQRFYQRMPLGKGVHLFTFGAHMHALFARAKREGLRMERETWRR